MAANILQQIKAITTSLAFGQMVFQDNKYQSCYHGNLSC